MVRRCGDDGIFHAWEDADDSSASKEHLLPEIGNDPNLFKRLTRYFSSQRHGGNVDEVRALFQPRSTLQIPRN